MKKQGIDRSDKKQTQTSFSFASTVKPILVLDCHQSTMQIKLVSVTFLLKALELTHF